MIDVSEMMILVAIFKFPKFIIIIESHLGITPSPYHYHRYNHHHNHYHQ
jgi:hypothetical protein